MNIYFHKIKDVELIQQLRNEARKQRRSVSYIVRLLLCKAFGIKNGGGD